MKIKKKREKRTTSIYVLFFVFIIFSPENICCQSSSLSSEGLSLS